MNGRIFLVPAQGQCEHNNINCCNRVRLFGTRCPTKVFTAVQCWNRDFKGLKKCRIAVDRKMKHREAWFLRLTRFRFRHTTPIIRQVGGYIYNLWFFIIFLSCRYCNVTCYAQHFRDDMIFWKSDCQRLQHCDVMYILLIQLCFLYRFYKVQIIRAQISTPAIFLDVGIVTTIDGIQCTRIYFHTYI